MELSPKEANLIHKIRTKYLFGEILVECRDGLPHRIKKTVEYEMLDGESFPQSFDLISKNSI